MISTQRVTAVVLSAAIMAGLGGCSLIEPQGTVVPLTGLAACAQGKTWNLDMPSLGESIKADLASQGIAATDFAIDGTQTMLWDVDGSVAIESDFTVVISTAPAPDQVQVVTTTHKGRATGASFVDKNVAIPRDWDATGTIITTVGDLDGAPIPIPFRVLNADLNDSVGVELTCDGDTLTTHPRGSSVTQTWKKG